MESILVSACLLGVCCKYSGGNNLRPELAALGARYVLIPVCPEQLGGLPTPRPPAECREERVVSQTGEDVTAQFQKGARETLRLARICGCRAAVLKARSPSCGSGEIYDGSFSGRTVPGSGITARALQAAGILVVTEEQLTELEGVISAAGQIPADFS